MAESNQTKQMSDLYKGDVEYTASKTIDYSLVLQDTLFKINNLMNPNQDIHNNISAFNALDLGVNMLRVQLGGYYDTEYKEQIRFVEEKKPTRIQDRVEKIMNKYYSCISLMKRKQFLPIDRRYETGFYIISDIYQRIMDEYDAQVYVWGERGTGKSTICLYLAGEIAEKFGLEFDPRKHVFFNGTDLRNYISEYHPKPGQPLIWDEAGAGKGLGRRRAMTKESIEYNEVIQVIREMGLVMFYTAPADQNFDSGTVDMFSCQIQTVTLDKINRISVVKYKFKEGKYWKFLQFQGNLINRCIIPKAAGKLIGLYKPLKKVFMQEKVKVKVDSKTQKERIGIDTVVADVLKDTGDFMKDYRGRKIVDHITVYNRYKDMGFTVIDSKEAKRLLEKKLNG